MTGKEILLKTLRQESTDRPAWVPFVGVHGGKLIGRSAKEYLQSSQLIIEGLSKAQSLYQPDGLPIVFDLQIEAEILGCQLQWADEVPPSVISHPLMNQTLSELPPFDATRGRYPIVIEALRSVKELFGDRVGLYGLVTGPFTLALHLMGSEIFLEMFDRPEYVKKVIQFCTDIAKKAADIYLDNGADIVAVVDPMTSQISPEHFQEYVAPYLDQIFDHIKNRRSFSSLFVCGDATRVLEEMCRTRCDSLCVDENISLSSLKKMADKNNKVIGGNLKLTMVLLLGSEHDAKLDALRCIDTCGQSGFILAPGCDLPYAVPEENLVAVGKMVHDDYERQIARNVVQAKEADMYEDIVLPKYHEESKVVVDIITLDSEACAPCQYMVEAVRESVQPFASEVIIKEHKIKSREGLGYMCKLGVKNLPTICIDGEVRFVSIIPDSTSLTEAIGEKVKSKKR